MLMQRASTSYRKGSEMQNQQTGGGIFYLWGHIGWVEGARPVLHAHLRMRIHRAPVAGPDW